MKSFYRLFLTICLLASSWLFVQCGTQTTIVNSIPEREANEIIVLLASKGIDASKDAVVSAIGGTGAAKYNIKVAAGKVTEALAVLNQAGFPRVSGTSLLDIFGGQGLVPSDWQDRIRYQEGLSEQLATTIRKMDGVLDANVQITFFDKTEQSTNDNPPPRASVYIKYGGVSVGLDNPNSLAITRVKRLVANAVPLLTPENVSVITDRALWTDIAVDVQQEDDAGGDLRSIWFVTVTKDSVMRFRLIFYCFLLLLFVFFAFAMWTLWKVWWVIRAEGGLTSFFSVQQYEQKRTAVRVPSIKDKTEENADDERYQKVLERTSDVIASSRRKQQVKSGEEKD